MGAVKVTAAMHGLYSMPGLSRSHGKMGIAQRKSGSGQRKKQNTWGWSRTGWHALFFLVGILLTCAGQFVFSSYSRAPRNGDAGANASGGVPRAAGKSRASDKGSNPPWGDLVITPMVLDRPDEFLDNQAAPAPAIRWSFPKYSAVELGEFIRSCELSDRQKASLLDTNHWQPGTNGWRIWPPRELVRELGESARARIYSVLAQSPENPQCFPFTCREDRFDEMFEGCDLSREKVAMVRQLCYRNHGLLYFADGQLFELMSSSNETRCLFATLLRVPTMLVKLKITADTDINALIRYWDTGGRAKDLRPLMNALARMPGGGSLNISYFLPPTPRLNLYTYPRFTNGLPLDCFWTSFNFFEEKPGYRLGDQEYADHLLHSDYSPVLGDKRLGDVLILVEDGYALHACVFIADDIYYTKNGTDPNQPWVLMRMKDMQAQYPSKEPHTWRVFRKKAT